MRLVGVGGEVRRKWRSDEPMQGDKHENSMKIEYSARLVVPAHEMAFSEGDRGAIMDRQRCDHRQRELGRLETSSTRYSLRAK